MAKIPYKCPVCDGHGTVQKPPWVAGDQDSWSSSGTPMYGCPACLGTGITWGEKADEFLPHYVISPQTSGDDYYGG